MQSLGSRIGLGDVGYHMVPQPYQGLGLKGPRLQAQF